MLFCSYVLILIGILANDIKCEGAIYIAEAIKKNKNILEIDLWNNIKTVFARNRRMAV